MKEIVKASRNLVEMPQNKTQLKQIINTGIPIIDLDNQNKKLEDLQIKNNLLNFQRIHPKIFDFFINCLGNQQDKKNISIEETKRFFNLTVTRKIINQYLDRNTFFRGLLQLNHQVFFKYKTQQYRTKIVILEDFGKIISVNNLKIQEQIEQVTIALPKILFCYLVEQKFSGDGFIEIPSSLYNKLEEKIKKEIENLKNEISGEIKGYKRINDIAYKLFTYSQLKNTNKVRTIQIEKIELLNYCTNDVQFINTQLYHQKRYYDIYREIKALINIFKQLNITTDFFYFVGSLFIN